jgi:hypothetical protein
VVADDRKFRQLEKMATNQGWWVIIPKSIAVFIGVIIIITVIFSGGAVEIGLWWNYCTSIRIINEQSIVSTV